MCGSQTVQEVCLPPLFPFLRLNWSKVESGNAKTMTPGATTLSLTLAFQKTTTETMPIQSVLVKLLKHGKKKEAKFKLHKPTPKLPAAFKLFLIHVNSNNNIKCPIITLINYRSDKYCESLKIMCSSHITIMRTWFGCCHIQSCCV